MTELARRCGIVDSYVDVHGERRETPIPTRAALLAAMGCPIEPAAARDALADWERREWQSPLPPVTVHREAGPPVVLVTLPETTTRWEWRVTLEDGGSVEGHADAASLELVALRTVDGVCYARRRLGLPGGMPLGYHTLAVQPGGRMTLIIAPSRCWLEPLAAGERLWGVTAQLYLLRSRGNWGIGDFGDLRELVKIMQPLGADIIGVNPLHALFPDQPEHASPYSPASRLLLNPLNIDVAQLAHQLDDASALEHIDGTDFQRRLAVCREAAAVRYTEVAALKFEVLRLLFANLRRKPLCPAASALRDFERDASPVLRRHCVFLALREHFVRQNPAWADWRRWPAAYRDPDSPAVRDFVSQYPESVAFQIWLQQVADAQLAAVADAALPMAIGVYRDLAVGADGAGAEVWANQGAVVSAAHVGAPPDVYIPGGQDWGLPPFNPRMLRAEAYRSFVELLRANMRHAHGLRIDHVMALMHLFWIPEGASPKDGTFVDYPLEDMLGVLALESHRQRCIVVGEDLGTVPEGFRERMNAAGVLSYRILFFERDGQEFVPPVAYPRLALAAFSSHDLPTLCGWWEGADIHANRSRGGYPTAQAADAAFAERDRDRRQLLAASSRAGLRDGPAKDGPADAAVSVDEFFAAAHAYLGASSAAIATAQLDDITDEVNPVNVPSTPAEHPNWRRRHSQTLEEIAVSPRLATLVGVFEAQSRHRR